MQPQKWSSNRHSLYIPSLISVLKPEISVHIQSFEIKVGCLNWISWFSSLHAFCVTLVWEWRSSFPWYRNQKAIMETTFSSNWVSNMYLYKNCFFVLERDNASLDNLHRFTQIYGHHLGKDTMGSSKYPHQTFVSNLLIFHVSICTHKISINFRMLFHRGLWNCT